jgi:FhuF 2Fe-2S C-terminal domain
MSKHGVSGYGRAGRSRSPSTELQAGLPAELAGLGPYFAVEARDPGTGPRVPWRPASELLDSAEALCGQVTVVRAGLAAAAGCPPAGVEFRVAASVAQLGLTARLISPALGAAVLGPGLPIDIGLLWWAPGPAGPIRLSLPAPVFAAGRDGGGLRRLAEAGPAVEPLLRLLDGPIRSLTEMTASMAVSRRVLWGNVASAVSGAAAMIAATRPELAAEAEALSSAMLGFPALAGRYDGRPLAGFRRRSCCLIYRMADPPWAQYCGDCVLAGPRGAGRRPLS